LALHLKYIKFLLGDAGLKDIIVIFLKFVSDVVTTLSTEIAMVIQAIQPLFSLIVSQIGSTVGRVIHDYSTLLLKPSTLLTADTIMQTFQQLLYEVQDMIVALSSTTMVLAHDLVKLVVNGIITAPYPPQLVPPLLTGVMTYAATRDRVLSVALILSAYAVAAVYY